MVSLYNIIDAILGLNDKDLSIMHMSIRGIVAYVYGIFLLQINRHLLNTSSQLTLMLFIMLGSIFATAITGNAPFFSVLFMVTILTIFNLALLKTAYYFPFLEKIIKGTPIELVVDGKVQWELMRQHSVTKRDLLRALRNKTGNNDLHAIKNAFLESTGRISIILKK